MKTYFLVSVVYILSFASNTFAQNHQEISFLSDEDLTITADLYHADKEAPTIILFHQSVSSRGEFRTIAPKLQEYGFNCLAVDLRWGKQDFWNDVPNKTAERNGTYEVVENYERTEEYQLNEVWPVIWKAYDDMKAAVSYISDAGYKGKTIVLGSSFSAMLVFKLAYDGYPIDGITAYSPGEYHPTDTTLLSNWAQKISQPVYLSAGSTELDMVKEIAGFLPDGLEPTIHHSKGRHGASVLIQEEQDWAPLLRFLDSFKGRERNIGFRVFELNRPSEEWDSLQQHKPVRAWYWYPQQSTSVGSGITKEEYIRQINPEKTIQENLTTFTRILTSFGSEQISEEALSTFLNEETTIHPNEYSSRNKSNLIVLSGAHPIYFTSLAEKIAGAGFSVLSVPRTGLKKGERLPFNSDGVREYKLDLLRAISYLQEKELVDTVGISFISWSFEGVPTLEIASNLNPKAFISLDSSIGYEYGEALLSDSVLSGISFPVTHYTGPESGYGKSTDLISRYSNHIKIVADYTLTHGEFTSVRSLTIPELKKEEAGLTYINLIEEIIEKIKE